jgi:hypothetical protein
MTIYYRTESSGLSISGLFQCNMGLKAQKWWRLKINFGQMAQLSLGKGSVFRRGYGGTRIESENQDFDSGGERLPRQGEHQRRY